MFLRAMTSRPVVVPHRIAVAQMTAISSQLENFETCSRLSREAREKGASMVFFPENFSFMGEKTGESVTKAEALSGPVLGRYRALAKELGLWLSLGGFQETGPDEAHMYNCHVVIDSQGEIKAKYRKIHLFDVDVENGPVLLESRYAAPGADLVAVDTPAGRLGLSICYDLRFPELYQALVFGAGASILAIPAAFTVPTGEAHWELLLRARAVECQSYVVAAAQAGKHNTLRESWGQSLIIDPWGKIVAQLPDRTCTGVALADLDPEYLRSVRERMPLAQHRKWGRICIEASGLDRPPQAGAPLPS